MPENEYCQTLASIQYIILKKISLNLKKKKKTGLSLHLFDIGEDEHNVLYLWPFDFSI